ncbi:MAG TPA: hypothetical protein VIV06_03350, partial [Candidatus Limnocylindrales bacterium]
TRAWLEELRLRPVVAGAFHGLGLEEGRAWAAIDTVRLLVTLPRDVRPGPPTRRAAGGAAGLLDAWLRDEDVRPFIRINRWEGVTWFEKEAFERLAGWHLLLGVVEATTDPDRPRPTVIRDLSRLAGVAAGLRSAGAEAGYRIDRLVAAIGSRGTRPAGRRR